MVSPAARRGRAGERDRMKDAADCSASALGEIDRVRTARDHEADRIEKRGGVLEDLACHRHAETAVAGDDGPELRLEIFVRDLVLSAEVEVEEPDDLFLRALPPIPELRDLTVHDTGIPAIERRLVVARRRVWLVVEADVLQRVDRAPADPVLEPEQVVVPAVTAGDRGRVVVAVPKDVRPLDVAGSPDDRDRPAFLRGGEVPLGQGLRCRLLHLLLRPEHLADDEARDPQGRRHPEAH